MISFVTRCDLKGTSFTCIFPERGNKLHGSKEKQASGRRMDSAEEFYEEPLMQMLHFVATNKIKYGCFIKLTLNSGCADYLEFYCCSTTALL